MQPNFAQGYSFIESIFTILLYNSIRQRYTIFPSSCVFICLRADCSAVSVKDGIYTVFTLVPGLELYQTLAVFEMWQASRISRLFYIVCKMNLR